ncbi:MAG TPA: hypothetical protein PLU30_22755 [Verrucomicrobiae bacterium]|nr:hypothetical protein [Verrucomicrobiae bacterium]
MAVKLIANYSKRLGLPAYSSHQFAVSVECEIANVADAAGESQRLYRLLQQSVDSQIVATGFVPPHGYGLNGEGGNGETDGQEPTEAPWKCSDRQRDLILKLVDEHHLQPADVEALARERFNKRVRELGKLEASGLIDELLEKHGGNGGRSNGNRRPRRNAYARGAA